MLFFSHIQLRGVGKAFKVVEHEEMLIFVSLCEWLVHYDPVDRMSVGYTLLPSGVTINLKIYTS